MEAYYEQKIRDSCTFVKWWSAQVANAAAHNSLNTIATTLGLSPTFPQ